MTCADRLLVIFLAMTMLGPAAPGSRCAKAASEPHSSSAERSAQPSGGAGDDHEAASTIETHRQKTIQRKSTEKVRSGAHDSRIRLDMPPDVFESPEAKTADHIPKPLPSDEVRAAPPAPSKTPRVVPATERAWALYESRRYQAAADLFEHVINSEPRQAQNARMGLVYSRLKLGKRTAALNDLEILVQRKYRLKETLPLFLNLTIAAGQHQRAERYLHLLPPSERNVWLQRILEGGLLARYRALTRKRTTAPAEWMHLVDRHYRALDRCIRPDIFFEAATRFKAQPYTAKSVTVHQALLECSLPPDLRLGVVDQLSGLLMPEAAIAMLAGEKSTFRLIAPRHLSKIDKLELRSLKRRLAELETGSPGRLTTANSILERDPSDRDARSIIAWSDLDKKKYEQSEAHFSSLWQADPQNRDYALGLGYSRLNLGRYDEALEPLDRSGFSDDERTLELRSLVHKARARQAYESQNWQVAGDNLEAAISADPADTDSIALLAWTRFQQGRREDARTLMESLYEREPSTASAGALLDMYQSGSEYDRSWRLAAEMADSGESGSQKKAADFFFAHRAPVSADQTYSTPEACYRGAAAPRAEAFFYHKNKSGDDGTSKLAETALPITATYPARRGKQWSLSLTPRRLSSGNAPDTPFAGRYYRQLNGIPQANRLEDDLWVWQPDLALEREGRIGLSAHLGTSPVGGAVDPTPTLGVRLSTDRWFVDLHRCSVKDSILSFAGLEDPYSSQQWGRVLRNGMAAGATWEIFGDYWLNASAGLDYYTGEHLWDNHSLDFNAAAGRTFDRNGDELTLGVFFTAQHFRRNSDFYTYGHGGYYSPELMTLVGPFVRYRSARCRTYWFDVQVSAGWLHQELDGSPVYPLFSGNVTGFTPAAAADALSEYKGESDDKLGLSAKVQGMKLITDRLALGGFAGIDNNADFTRWQVGAGLQFFFEPQNAFWQRRDFFKDFGDCSNR